MARHRVPIQMHDSLAPMITDGTSDPLGLHRPGWRIARAAANAMCSSATVSASSSKKHTLST
jgi:hypothetical protein